LIWLWRMYASVAFLFLVARALTLVGPDAAPLFAPYRGVDVGAFYTVATMVREGRRHELGNVDAQRAVQQALQQREHTNWRWFEPMPHPPVVALIALPLTLLSLRAAYWEFTVVAAVAAVAAAWLVARAVAPRAAVATTLILLSFRPLWTVLFWGEDDTFVLLPFMVGVTLLLAPPADGVRSRRRELVAGLLMGAIAIRPQFVPVPILALALGRRAWATIGMLASGGALGLVSVVTVGPGGVRAYIDLWIRYSSAKLWLPGVRPDLMFNLRGVITRLNLAMGVTTQDRMTLALSIAVGIAVVLAGAEMLRGDRAPDLAMSTVVLGMLLTSLHTHQQSMVFLYLPLAVSIGRSLAATTFVRRLGWAMAAVALHGADAVLGKELTRQTVMTEIGLVLLIGFALAGLARGGALSHAWAFAPRRRQTSS
jgi:Glycosyltransferase family 87